MAAALVIAVGLVGNVATGLVRLPPSTQPWVWALLAVLAVLVVVVEGWRGRERDGEPPEQLRDRLARQVAVQWAREAAAQGLRQPLPLRVRWSSTRRPVSAAPEVVVEDPGLWPLSGDVGDIVDAYRRLPHGQLVVIGEPGTGKTVLAVTLTLGLVEHAGPVPVLMSAASWKPRTEKADTFVVRTLAEEYPFLTRRDAGRLLEEGHVLPLVDGLDEIAADARDAALKSLDRFAAAGRPLVVTCRAAEYERAVAASGWLLSRAAVVEIEPVGADEAATFLSHPATGRERWRTVFEHLRRHPEGPLASALSTPLMVSLARSAYSRPATDPAGLLEPQDRASVEGMLIDTYVDAAYQPRPARARRWLSSLAYLLRLNGTPDLLWWELRPGSASRDPERAAWSLPALAALALATAAGLATGLLAGPWKGVVAGLGTAAVIGLHAGRVFQVLWPDGRPRYVPLTFRTPAELRRLVTRRRMAFGLLSGALTGLLGPSLWIGLAGGLVVGAIPVRADPPWRAGAFYGLLGGAVCTVLAEVTGQPLSAGAAAFLVFGTSAALGAGVWVWIRFRVTHAQLALRGGLPWRLTAFLKDAHRRGMLRGNGTAWQFRHALLRDRLAEDAFLRHLTLRADAGETYAAIKLAETHAARGQTDVLRARAGAGDPHAARHLAESLVRQDRPGEAIAVLRAHAAELAEPLAELLEKEGRANEAVAVLRAAPPRGHGAQLAGILERQGRTDEAVAVLREFTDAGGTNGYNLLLSLLVRLGRIDDIRACADAGMANAAATLDRLLAERGCVDELRARSAAADGHATVALVGLLRARGDVEGAITVLRDIADAGQWWEAPWRLADLLVAHGRVEELTARADAGDHHARERLAKLLIADGRLDVLRTRAEAGDGYAAQELTDVLIREGRPDEAVPLLRPYGPTARFIELLYERGLADELRVHAEAGDEHAAWRLAILLSLGDRTDEGLAVLRSFADAGNWWAAARLVNLLARKGRTDELRARADSGDTHAVEALTDLLVERGHLDEALDLLRAHADRSDPARRLADLLAEHGRTDELRTRAESGDGDAAARLARLLAERGDLEDARAILRARATAGDQRAASQLSDLA
ncbi:hypothetical protein [Sphaerisporangium aureirubrum]|uniref:NACHT domain-containing protein n=1 Tax=Sphaerisporangium aureirubrum TaxID=1544736 RepID=A0ABW1NDY7_9ACTN